MQLPPREKALDGVYIIRTPESADSLSAEDAVRAYKQLGDVEKAFRTLKGLDLRIRPIHHRLEKRVRAHMFLCMLLIRLGIELPNVSKIIENVVPKMT